MFFPSKSSMPSPPTIPKFLFSFSFSIARVATICEDDVTRKPSVRMMWHLNHLWWSCIISHTDHLGLSSLAQTICDEPSVMIMWHPNHLWWSSPTQTICRATHLCFLFFFPPPFSLQFFQWRTRKRSATLSLLWLSLLWLSLFPFSFAVFPNSRHCHGAGCERGRRVRRVGCPRLARLHSRWPPCRYYRMCSLTIECVLLL